MIMEPSDNFKKLLKDYGRENIKFSKHAYIRLTQRKFDKDFVIQKLYLTKGKKTPYFNRVDELSLNSLKT